MVLQRRLVLVGLAAAALWPAAPAVAEDGKSAAGLVFETPYLEAVEANSALTYRIEMATTDEALFGAPFQDEVTLTVLPGPPGGKAKTAILDIMTGSRRRTIGPMREVRGNPAVMVLLEQDAFHLNRILGGQPAYFRNRIRKAFREAAAVEPVRVAYDGRELAGHKVTIHPFRDDPNPSRMREFAGQTYEFIVADQVPGGLYSIVSYVPAPVPGAARLSEQRLTLTGLAKL